jgi:hypothetical protein
MSNYDEFRFFTGLRPSEEIALVVTDYDPIGGVLSVTKARVSGIDLTIASSSRRTALRFGSWTACIAGGGIPRSASQSGIASPTPRVIPRSAGTSCSGAICCSWRNSTATASSPCCRCTRRGSARVRRQTSRRFTEPWALLLMPLVARPQNRPDLPIGPPARPWRRSEGIA